MSANFRAGLFAVLGLALIVTALAITAVLLRTPPWALGVGAVGVLLATKGAFGLRQELAWLARRRRAEIAAFSLGAVCLFAGLGYLSASFTARFDMTEAGLHSLSTQAQSMLRALDKPVHVTFFHDHLMRETRELCELMAKHSEQLSVEFHDPTLNPARARLMGVQFAGTAVLRSGDNELQVNGGSEAAIANGILRVTQGARQTVCFLQGHKEADPFSMESHDHSEASAGTDHAHGLGVDYVLHESHGLAKARGSLETFNYVARALSLVSSSDELAGCRVLIVAGPKVALLPADISAIRGYLRAGGNALFMLDPFVTTGLEPVLAEYGIVADASIIIDEASHYWTDVSAPAVTRYSNHQVTRDVALTFYPGARPLSPTDVRIPGTSVTPAVNSSPSSFADSGTANAKFDKGIDRAGPLTLMVISNRRPLQAGDGSESDLGSDTQARKARIAELVGDAPWQVTGHSRVAVIGDADFATNSFFHFLGNGDLFLNTVNYLAAQENLIGIEPRTRDLPKLSVTNRQLKGTFVLSMLLVPGLLGMVGTLVWWQQR